MNKTILELLATSNYVMYNVVIAKKTSINAAILLGYIASQIKYHKTNEVFLTTQMISDYTGLSLKEIPAAAKILKELSIINVVLKGIPAKNHYSINSDTIENLVYNESEIETSVTETVNTDLLKQENKFYENGKTTIAKTDKLLINSKRINSNEINSNNNNSEILHISDDGKNFASYFRSLLPNTQKVTSSDMNKWAKIYDSLINLDKRTKDEIYKVTKWARSDNFWSSNFLSATKLRNRNKEGVYFYDVFLEKIKQEYYKPVKADFYGKYGKQNG